MSSSGAKFPTLPKANDDAANLKSIPAEVKSQTISGSQQGLYNTFVHLANAEPAWLEARAVHMAPIFKNELPVLLNHCDAITPAQKENLISHFQKKHSEFYNKYIEPYLKQYKGEEKKEQKSRDQSDIARARSSQHSFFSEEPQFPGGPGGPFGSAPTPDIESAVPTEVKPIISLVGPPGGAATHEVKGKEELGQQKKQLFQMALENFGISRVGAEKIDGMTFKHTYSSGYFDLGQSQRESNILDKAISNDEFKKFGIDVPKSAIKTTSIGSSLEEYFSHTIEIDLNKVNLLVDLEKKMGGKEPREKKKEIKEAEPGSPRRKR